MVIKLLPDQVSKFWDFIRSTVLSSPSPIATLDTEGIRNVLKSLLMEEAQCWLVYTKENDKVVVHGFVITTIAVDLISKGRFLNIYDMYMVRRLTEELWADGYKAIEEFARANGCSKITGYTDIPRVVDVAQKLGFNTSTVFLIKEV